MQVSTVTRICWLSFNIKKWQHTFMCCKSCRGKLEIWLPLEELVRLDPIPLLVILFLLFLRFCLRWSWSILLCFLFVKKTLWGSSKHNWTSLGVRNTSTLILWLDCSHVRSKYMYNMLLGQNALHNILLVSNSTHIKALANQCTRREMVATRIISYTMYCIMVHSSTD